MTLLPPRRRRLLGSLLYEALVVFSLLMVAFWIPQIMLFAAGVQLSGKLLFLHLFLILMAYFMWFWIHGGQTLPMKTWRIRLVGAEGHPLRPMQALLRYLAAWPSTLSLVGILWIYLDRDRRFLHDRIAGTRIISLD